MMYVSYSFFFSSRRRHTRWPRDWSSDVCSSDLTAIAVVLDRVHEEGLVEVRGHLARMMSSRGLSDSPLFTIPEAVLRSEERRVGKECRSWGAQTYEKKERTDEAGEESERENLRR